MRTVLLLISLVCAALQGCTSVLIPAPLSLEQRLQQLSGSVERTPLTYIELAEAAFLENNEVVGLSALREACYLQINTDNQTEYCLQLWEAAYRFDNANMLFDASVALYLGTQEDNWLEQARHATVSPHQESILEGLTHPDVSFCRHAQFPPSLRGYICYQAAVRGDRESAIYATDVFQQLNAQRRLADVFFLRAHHALEDGKHAEARRYAITAATFLARINDQERLQIVRRWYRSIP